jgi:uncharacterized membrane protein
MVSSTIGNDLAHCIINEVKTHDKMKTKGGLYMNFFLKLLLNSIVLIPLLLWFTGAPLFSIVLAALGLCVLAYLVGDLFILRATNNTVATIADGVMAFIYLWAVAYFADWALSFSELFVTVLALAFVEAIFHRMIARDRVRT